MSSIASFPAPIPATDAPSFLDGEVVTVLVLLLAGLLAVFGWLTPNHYPPWLSFHGEAAMAAAIALASAWTLWRSRGTRRGMPALAAATLAAAVIPAIQFLVGQIDFAGDAWLAGSYLAAFGFAQWIGQRAAGHFGVERTVAAIAAVVLSSALLSAWIALYQWQRLDYLGMLAIQISRGMRPYANLTQPNHLATLLVLGLCSVAWLFDRRYVGAAGSLLAVLLLGFTLAMTQSRAGLLEVVVVAALLVAFRRVLHGRLRWSHGVGAAALVLLLPFAWEALRAQAPSATGREAGELATVSLRRLHWETMLDAVGRHPWGGYGWNQVSAAQFAVAADHAVSGETLGYSHNLLLDLLVWNGIPLGLLLAGALAWWFWAAARGLRDSTTLLALAGIVAVFVHAMLEYPLYYTYFLLPVGVLMGVVSWTTLPRAVLRVPRFVAPILLALGCAVLAVTAVEYFSIEDEVRRLRFRQARMGMSQAVPEPNNARLLTQLREFLFFARTRERAGMSPAELEVMAAIVRRFPSRENIVRYAAALALNAQPERAEQTLRPLCHINLEGDCLAMKALWTALGKTQPAIAIVPWPVR